jgi:ketosteroid isomerase-like protein
MKTVTILLASIAISSTALGQDKHGTDVSGNNKKDKTQMKTTAEQSEIENLLTSYSQALNASDVSKTVALYAIDGTLMPNGAPISHSRHQLSKTYDMLFKAFKLDVEYISDEIIIAGEYAFAQTHSNGKTTILASGEILPIENKELFIFRKDNGQWKISHYIFNSNKMK